MKKQYKVSAPVYGIIRDGFSTRYQAQKFARRWERDNALGERCAVAHTLHPIVGNSELEVR